MFFQKTSVVDNISHDPKKVIYSFSNDHITDSDELLLIKGLNFAIPSKKNEYSKFLLPLELLFRDIKSNSESSVDLTSVKARLQDTAFTSYSAFNKDNCPSSNLRTNLNHCANLKMRTTLLLNGKQG